jgi:hypothetical protein
MIVDVHHEFGFAFRRMLPCIILHVLLLLFFFFFFRIKGSQGVSRDRNNQRVLRKVFQKGMIGIINTNLP